MADHETKKFWLIIDGKIVTDHKIEAYTFGKLLTNLQKVVDVFKQTKYREHPKKDFKLYLTNMTEGSVAVAFQPLDYTTTLLDQSMVFDDMVFDLQDLITTLMDNPDEFRQKIERDFEDTSQIIRFLESFRGMLSKKNKFNVKIGYNIRKPKKPLVLPSHREPFIEELISEYYRKSAIEIKGVITRIKGDDPRSFTIKTLEDDTIKCDYPPDWEKDVMTFFKSTVTVKGVMSTRARLKEMEVIKDIQPFKSIILEELDEFVFRQPLAIRVSYDDKDDHWCLANEELSLAGYGETYEDARLSLKDSFESLVIGYLAFNDSSLSEKSRLIKKKLQTYVDLDEYRAQASDLKVVS
jgi:hypothetical protein